MKASILKRLQNLEQAASGHARLPLVLIDVTKIPEADRNAYRAGDETILLRFGAPDPAQMPPGQIHTIVIDLHPAFSDRRLEVDDFEENDA